MTDKKTDQNLLDLVWEILASIRLTIITLLAIAGTAVIGTVIPQNRPLDFYELKYGETFFKLIKSLNLLDMYHSFWFQALILILALNILACSWERLKIAGKIIFPGRISFSEKAFKASAATEPATVKRPASLLMDHYQITVARAFPITMTRPTENGFFVFAEKGRKTRLGVYVVHLSILLLLAGALTGSIFGFEAFVNIPEGETVDSVKLRQSSETRELGFKIRCDYFSVAFYDSGRPKDYRSGLSVIENDTVVLDKDIRVNDPLKHKGITFFQSSYGTASVKNVTVTFTHRDSGREHSRTMDIGDKEVLPGEAGEFTLMGFRASYPFQMMNRTRDVGETLIGMLEKAEERNFIPLPLRFPNFDRMRGGEWVIAVSDFERTYYTGLQVRNDPGVLIVYAGFILMIIGIYMAFFMSHQRFCFHVRGVDDNTSLLTVSWKANKNEAAARRKAEKMRDRLAGPSL